MKIVHIISSFSPGGAEILVKDMAIITKGENSAQIWAVGSAGDKIFEEKYKKELKDNNVEFINVGKVLHKNRIKVILDLRKLIKLKKPDIINTHSELATFYCVPASIGLNVKVVQTIHNTVVIFPFYQRFIFKPFIKKYIAISAKCKILIKNVIKADESKIELIYNGINTGKFRNRLREIRLVENILCIGRLDVQKDHETLIKAFALLKEKLNNFSYKVPKLNLVGIGPLKDKLQNLSAELNIKNEVIFLGARNDIPELLSLNDIWVMSSKWEGLSIALLEAISTGIPIIATNVGSNDEVIDNDINGKLIPKENPQALADALLTLITNSSLRERYSANAVKKASSFKIETCVNNYLNMYNSLFNVHGEYSFSSQEMK